MMMNIRATIPVHRIYSTTTRDGSWVELVCAERAMETCSAVFQIWDGVKWVEIERPFMVNPGERVVVREGQVLAENDEIMAELEYLENQLPGNQT